MTEFTPRVLADIAAERDAQDQKWGLQRLADTDGSGDNGAMLLGRPFAVWEQIMKHRCDSLRDEYTAGGDDRRNMTVATLEEVFECLTAMLSGDRAAFRKEAVQAAAMFTKWVEIHDHDDAVADYRAYTLDPGAWITANTVNGIRPHIPRDPDVPPDLRPVIFGPEDWAWGYDFPAALLETGAVTPETIDDNYRKDLEEDRPGVPPVVVDGVRHFHDYDRLHGICRCGESRPVADVVPRTPCACGQDGCEYCDIPETD